MPAHPIWNVPNVLSASRVPLGIALFAAVSAEAWGTGLGLFSAAAFTDWLDGFWARRFGPLTAVGRNLDPLTDKFLICGAFVYLLPVVEAALHPWMVTLVIGREILITGIRGIVETEGHKFPADGFGKLKTVSQCAWILCVLAGLAFRPAGGLWLDYLLVVQLALLGLVIFTTAWSGLSYSVKAARLLNGKPAGSTVPGGMKTVAALGAALLAAGGATVFRGPGSDLPPPAGPEYLLPWDPGASHLCVQGNAGFISHSGREEFAFDFAMPIGTPIRAARAGTVALVEVSNTGYGVGSPGNHVIVVHADKTWGVYAHLRRDGAKVGYGEKVAAGDVIAVSGNVGNSMLPHLHFHVATGGGQTVPIRFAGVPGGMPRAGDVVTAPGP